MDIAYFNCEFLQKDKIKISPDDRGFLFADGIYEVVKWYSGFFYDLDGHVARMKRSLREIRINCPEADYFPFFAVELIKLNQLYDCQALIYLQVTRGAASRTHSFPDPEVKPTVYASVKEFIPAGKLPNSGVNVLLREDIRWSRCDIKSVSLLANTLSFQEAHEKGLFECIFVRNGLITEGSHSNFFFVIDGTLYTHPESEHILSGITRKNVIHIAKEAGIIVKEEPLPEKKLGIIHEAFITSTSTEVTPVVGINNLIVGNGIPGPVTELIQKNFQAEILTLKG